MISASKNCLGFLTQSRYFKFLLKRCLSTKNICFLTLKIISVLFPHKCKLFDMLRMRTKLNLSEKKSFIWCFEKCFPTHAKVFLCSNLADLWTDCTMQKTFWHFWNKSIFLWFCFIASFPVEKYGNYKKPASFNLKNLTFMFYNKFIFIFYLKFKKCSEFHLLWSYQITKVLFSPKSYLAQIEFQNWWNSSKIPVNIYRQFN